MKLKAEIGDDSTTSTTTNEKIIALEKEIQNQNDEVGW